jgi:transcriptional regulator with XRE-family HTH domain
MAVKKAASRRKPLNPLAVRFGKNLRRCRKRVGLTQEKLAALSAVHRTEVTKLEKGERPPRIDTAVKVATVLSVSLDELTTGINWKPGRVQEGGFSKA